MGQEARGMGQEARDMAQEARAKETRRKGRRRKRKGGHGEGRKGERDKGKGVNGVTMPTQREWVSLSSLLRKPVAVFLPVQNELYHKRRALNEFDTIFIQGQARYVVHLSTFLPLSPTMSTRECDTTL